VNSKTLSEDIGEKVVESSGKEIMSRNVIVLEPSAAERQTIRFILSRDNMAVDFALSCDELKVELEKKIVDLIIVDEGFDDFSVDCLKELYSNEPKNRRVPVLLLTGEESLGEEFPGDVEHPSLRLAKPFSSDALRGAVRKILS